MADNDPMNVEGVLEKLHTALRLQSRSLLELTLVAGSLRGPNGPSLERLLSSYATAELDDLRRLVQEVVSLGGSPAVELAPLGAESDPERALGTLIEHECDALAALHGVLPDTGQEPRSEALEHRLEHIIMRKREQVETLRRALPPEGNA